MSFVVSHGTLYLGLFMNCLEKNNYGWKVLSTCSSLKHVLGVCMTAKVCLTVTSNFLYNHAYYKKLYS